MPTNDNVPQINLLSAEDNVRPKGKKIFKISRLVTYIAAILTVTFFIFSYQVLFTDNSLSESLGGLNIFKQLTTMARGDAVLDGIDEDRINILLLGMGGPGHDGPYLTDTIIVASIQPSTNKIALLSIPRDLLVNIPGYGSWKINNANHFGEKENPGHGADLSAKVVSEVTGLPIHYTIRIDFPGFEQLIDDLGGVKVYVDRSFTDFEYPATNHQYQTLHFEEGWTTMDGDTALKYVRSRHGNNGEGSDFARSKRQQKVMQAFKERVFSVNTFLSPRKISKLVQAFGDHIRTNMELADLNEFAKLAKKLDTKNIITQVLDDSADGYLYPSIVNGAYVLQPKSGSFDQIQFLAENIFTSQHAISEKPTASIEIKNGTLITGLAYDTSKQMRTLGFKILNIGNAETKDYKKTVIYSIGDNYETKTANILKSYFQTDINRNPPDWVRKDADISSNYYIILGEDRQQS